MTAAEIRTLVSDLAEPLCDAEGMELVLVEYQREHGGRTLRLYIDRPGGTRLDDCVRISRQLNDLLDVYLEHASAYHLEVSSPGPERPLGKRADFDRFEGSCVKIRMQEPIAGQRNFRGILAGLMDENVLLMVGNQTIALPFGQVKSARLVDNHGENRCL